MNQVMLSPEHVGVLMGLCFGLLTLVVILWVQLFISSKPVRCLLKFRSRARPPVLQQHTHPRPSQLQRIRIQLHGVVVPATCAVAKTWEASSVECASNCRVPCVALCPAFTCSPAPLVQWSKTSDLLLHHHVVRTPAHTPLPTHTLHPASPPTPRYDFKGEQYSVGWSRTTSQIATAYTAATRGRLDGVAIHPAHPEAGLPPCAVWSPTLDWQLLGLGSAALVLAWVGGGVPVLVSWHHWPALVVPCVVSVLWLVAGVPLGRVLLWSVWRQSLRGECGEAFVDEDGWPVSSANFRKLLRPAPPPANWWGTYGEGAKQKSVRIMKLSLKRATKAAVTPTRRTQTWVD